MLSGNVFLGISYALGLGLIIPEIIETVKQKENVDENDELTQEKISDLATGLYSAFNAVGSFFAPIIGGLVSEKIGF